MAALIASALLLITICSLQHNSIVAETVAQSDSSSYNLFASDLLPLVADNKLTQNVVYAPFSIYASLALTLLGAEDSTADELRKVLKLKQEEKEKFASRYGHFLKSTFRKTKADDNDQVAQLKMANRLYVGDKIKILQQFNKMAEENFDCKAENVDFSDALTTVEKINKWVEQQTANKIKNLIKPDAVNGKTTAVLVNAMYFRGEWLHPFSKLFTYKTSFHMSHNAKSEVETMYTEEKFGYVELPTLNASALEMPYANFSMSMLIILPNRNSDLKQLLERLKKTDLNEITSKMVVQTTEVHLPRFKIEFEVNLKESLQKMGCSAMFGDKANLTSIFEGAISQKIEDIKHKAFLDCNEAGSEAAAASFIKFGYKSFNPFKKVFRANRPFAFFIRTKAAVLFAGHVAKL